MSDSAEIQPPEDTPKVVYTEYDRNTLTYANSFTNPLQSGFVRILEWFTGKATVLRMIRQFEKSGAPSGPAFWRGCLDVMGIELLTPTEQMENFPHEGPVVVVANHPHGMVDGMIMAELVGQKRGDYKILTRSVLTGIDAVASSYLIPVPFLHDPDMQRKSVEMRASAMAHLKAGGVVSVFPSGLVASSDSMMGPAIEAEWNVFTAQLIRRSGARVVPVFFPGSNSRAYQMANRISATLRQGLLIHEIVHACNRPQSPIIGAPLTDAQMARLSKDPRGFMAWLREYTLALGQE